MKKHVALFLVALLTLPVIAFAENKNTVNIGKAVLNADNTITVPVEISNRDNLTAMEIPLKYSESVGLKEVSFAGTRVEYFDLKVGRNLPDKNSVIIGLFSQMSPTRKPELAAGTGVVANLIFQAKNPDLVEFTVEPTTLEFPHHSLMFIYRHFNADGSVRGSLKEPVEFGGTTVSLSGSVSADLPTVYDLEQNYPNDAGPGGGHADAAELAGDRAAAQPCPDRVPGGAAGEGGSFQCRPDPPGPVVNHEDATLRYC